MDTIGLLETKEEFEATLTPDTKFFMLSVFENIPGWALTYPTEKNLTILHGYADEANNPLLIIYKLE